jgi:hypothetical protein
MYRRTSAKRRSAKIRAWTASRSAKARWRNREIKGPKKSAKAQARRDPPGSAKRKKAHAQLWLTHQTNIYIFFQIEWFLLQN